MASLLRTRKLAWLLSLLIATLALTFSYVSGRSYLKALGLVEHTVNVERTLTSLLSSLRAQESDTRGFIVSGDRVFLENVEQERAASERSLGELRELVRDNPAQLARLSRLTDITEKKLAFMEKTVALRERGATSELQALVASRRGKILMDRLRTTVSYMEAEESQLLTRRTAAAERTQYETVLAIALGTVVLVLLLGMSFFGMQRDAASLRAASEELAESEERYRILVENAHELVRLHGADGHPFFVSASCQALLGYTPEECIRSEPFALVHSDDIDLAKTTLAKLQSGELRRVLVTYRLRHRSGEHRFFEFDVARVNGAAGEFRHYQSVGRDVTVRRELEQKLAAQTEQLRDLSLRDGLTNLYNRRGFLELSAQVVRMAEREHHALALLFVDLDGLKGINDNLGHEQGDQAIVEVGALLRSTCRATDIVARLGGDEFVVLAGNIGDEGIEVLKRHLLEAVARANLAPGRDYQLAFSLGVARFDPNAPVAIETLISEADARMYEAKARRRPVVIGRERVGVA
jgi:diguanylate cyclase (GGDEF)-like protein/PAS domain S-box-containing protein